MSREDLLKVITRGNDDATDFLSRCISAFHTWDDLIDQDKTVSPDEITKAFFFAFVGLPTNNFFAANYSHLFPVLTNSITNWLAANDMEREPETELDTEIAFIIRSEYINLIIETARLCGGHAWAQDVTATVRRFSHAEGYKGYMAALQAEKETRDAHNKII